MDTQATQRDEDNAQEHGTPPGAGGAPAPSRAGGMSAADPALGEAEQSRRTRAWTHALAIGCAALLALTMARVTQLKLWPHDELAGAAGSRTSTKREIAQRGDILDQRGRPLAMSLVGYRLFCDPVWIYEKGWETAKKRVKTDPSALGECDPYRDAAIALAPVLRQRPQQVFETLKANADRRYVVLAQELDDAQTDAIRQLDLPGIGLEPKLVREYPAGAVGSAIVGKVGFEHTGQAGVEFTQNRRMTPVDGAMTFLRDVQRRPLWIDRDDYVRGDPGDDVRLTIDLVVQEAAERHLQRMVEETNAGGGRLVVMDVETGDILALADTLRQRPGWTEVATDPARKIHPALGRNRCVTDPYEPGSTFKAFVWARATELGKARPEEIIPLGTGPYRTSFGRVIRDVKYPGPVSWKTVLVKSLNGGMAIVGQRMSFAEMQDVVRDFGFGQRVGIGIAGETTGLITAPAKWSAYTQTSVAMGHEIGVTPVQMVRAFSAFCRPDGTMVTPRLILPAGWSGAREYQTSGRQVVDPAVMRVAREAMSGVVEEGTARRAQSEKYRMFGKTGTAQLPKPKGMGKGYFEDRYVASFIAGAPFDHPRIVVLAVIDDPDKRKGHFGGSIAGPVVRDVVDETLEYLGVPHDQGEDKKERIHGLAAAGGH
jgi:cell division protein FtsI (penicillin-binding protein 3)